MSSSETARKILLAAVDIINNHGTEAITTRSLAQAAGVNNAAINYHFGSKEFLIEQVLNMTMAHLFSDWDMIVSEPSLDLQEKVFYLLDYMMEGISRYPGLTRSYLFHKDFCRNASAQFTGKLHAVLDSLSALHSQETGVSEDLARLALGQAVLSVLSTAVVPETFTMLAGDGLSSQRARRSFILPLVNRIPGIKLEISLPFLERIERVRQLAFQ